MRTFRRLNCTCDDRATLEGQDHVEILAARAGLDTGYVFIKNIHMIMGIWRNTECCFLHIGAKRTTRNQTDFCKFQIFLIVLLLYSLTFTILYVKERGKKLLDFESNTFSSHNVKKLN